MAGTAVDHPVAEVVAVDPRHRRNSDRAPRRLRLELQARDSSVAEEVMAVS